MLNKFFTHEDFVISIFTQFNTSKAGLLDGLLDSLTDNDAVFGGKHIVVHLRLEAQLVRVEPVQSFSFFKGVQIELLDSLDLSFFQNLIEDEFCSLISLFKGGFF